jgi:hypothetical protein
MSATKTWAIGDVLTASDLNSNFTKLPYSTSAFTATQSGALAVNTGTTVAVVFPASRFSVAPIVTVSTNSTVLTAYVSAVNAGTATIGVYNNGAASSGATTTIYGMAVQMTSGTAAG